MVNGRAMRPRDITADYWPGFVDALAVLVLVFMLLMTILFFTASAQNRLGATYSGGGSELRAQVAELTDLLTTKRREAELLEEERGRLQIMVESLQAGAAAAEQVGPPGPGEEKDLPGQLAEQRRIAATAQKELELQNRQLLALQRQIESLQEALDASDEADRENKTSIADMSRRVNAAMARNAQGLSKYRAEFLEDLRKNLGDDDTMRSERNRYVIQADVLFSEGTVELTPVGRALLVKLGFAIKKIEEDIPDEVGWLIRVDGHTDKKPIEGSGFASDMHLSAAQAITVVNFLHRNGVATGRLAATGLGSHLPLEEGTNEDAYRRNRRIEIKFMER